LRLGGADASGWLTVFYHDPDKAVSELLWNRFYFGPLNLTERDQLLANWLELLGDAEEFSSRLDRAFSSWIEQNWGQFEQPAASLVSAWICLASVVESSAKLNAPARLSKAADALRARFPLRDRFLGSFSTAPAADPLGCYLAVIAEFQGDDRSLAGFWHRLCDLPDGVPFYHAPYAILGLRRLHSMNNWEDGTLRAEVVLGLLRLANAFDRLVRERGLSEGVARSTFRRVAVQLAAAYRGSLRWGEHGLAYALKMSERPRKWVMEAIPPLAMAVRQEKAKADRHAPRPSPCLQPDPAWTDRAKSLANDLRSSSLGCLSEVSRLLDEQRRYAEATGDTYSVVRSLRNFAIRVLRRRPDLAVGWAEQACSLAPHDPWSWTTIIEVLLKQKNVSRALHFAWVAWKRFPENVVARNGLAEVLKAAERYPEAEEVYRQTIERFPVEIDRKNYIIARNGLADTLRWAGRWEDAEKFYCDSIEAGLMNCATFVGLAYLLLRKGEAGRAEALSLVDRALALDRRNPYALPLRQKLQTARGDEVSALYEEYEQSADELPVLSEVRQIDEGVDSEEFEVGDIHIPESRTDSAQAVRTTAGGDPTAAAHQTSPTRQPPIGDVLEVAALIAEAHFYRSWAARSPAECAPAHREKAAALLAEAEKLLPQDAQILAEKLALDWSQGANDQPAKALMTQLANHPGAAPLLVLKARLDRETARRAQRKLDAATLAELLDAPNRLRHLDLALMPVFHLEKGHAALALLDGAFRIKTATEAFTNFRHTVARRANEERADRQASHDTRTQNLPRFHEWLQTTANNRLFPSITDPERVRVEDLPAVERVMSERPWIFDEIEDSIVDRLAFAGV
jgi:tetratricopeptide (TPR) repeat protein